MSKFTKKNYRKKSNPGKETKKARVSSKTKKIKGGGNDIIQERISKLESENSEIQNKIKEMKSVLEPLNDGKIEHIKQAKDIADEINKLRRKENNNIQRLNEIHYLFIKGDISPEQIIKDDHGDDDDDEAEHVTDDGAAQPTEGNTRNAIDNSIIDESERDDGLDAQKLKNNNSEDDIKELIENKIKTEITAKLSS